MKLAVLHFNSTSVAIPGWVRQLGGTTTGYDSMFTAEDGWDLERVECFVYRLMREGMPHPAFVDSMSASYTVLQPIDKIKQARKERRRRSDRDVTAG